MHTMALPWIEEADYPAFKVLITGLPCGYEDWVDHQRAVAAFLQARGGAPEIAITPEEFCRYLCLSGRPASEAELWIFVTMLVERVNRKASDG